jgi:hypothetical protein
MDAALPDLLTALESWSAALPGVLRAEATPAGRARALAELLQRLLPSASAGCTLEDAEDVTSGPDSGDAVRAPFGTAGGPRGHLRLGPADLGPEARARLALFLELAARFLNQELHLEELWQEQAECADLATLGEAMAHVAHAVGNHLNSMLLQAAVVQMHVEQARREELAQLRREGVQAAARLRPLQQARTRYGPTGEPTDLGHLVGALLAGDADLAARVRVEPGADLPPLAYPRWPLRRLVALLLRIALSCHTGTAPVRVTTALRDGEGQLLLEVEGLAVEQEGNFADLPPVAEGGVSELERSAAEGLARRLNARLALLPHEGGAALAVCWPVADA